LSRLHRPGPFLLSPIFFAASLYGAGALFARTVVDAPPRPRLPDSAPPIVASASARDVQDLAPATTVTVSIDTTGSCAVDTTRMQEIRTALDGALNVGSTAAKNIDCALNVAYCSQWARLGTSAAPVYWGLNGPSDKISVYAVHSRDGATVCFTNQAANDVIVRPRVRLAQCPYRIERLTVTMHRETERDKSSSDNVSPDRVAANRPDVVLTRLKGRDVTNTGVVILPMALHPGETSILRFTDSAYASRVALNEVRSQLHRLPHSSGELARRLHVIFDGSGSFEKAIASASRLSPDRRRGDIHRFLLVLGQAYSLHRNFQITNAVQAQIGVAFRLALDRLNDSLADTSATLMGLVPEITVSPDPPGSLRTARTRTVVSERSGDEPHTAYATVALSNQGSHSIELVKIGMELSALPTGVHCDPSEPALFGTLAPGQTVRATYLLHWKGPVAPRHCCIGDISYFTAGAPAHLRPRFW
jgi:hypothetical protein